MNTTTILRTGYWAGIIGDFFIAVTILVPVLARVDRYVYPMGLMSAAAFSWGIMLIIADRKPVERRWISVPTLLVVVLIQLATFLSLPFVEIPPWQLALSAAGGVIVFSFLLIGYLKTGNSGKVSENDGARPPQKED